MEPRISDYDSTLVKSRATENDHQKQNTEHNTIDNQNALLINIMINDDIKKNNQSSFLDTILPIYPVQQLNLNRNTSPLRGHKSFVYCLIQLNDGRIGSCSADKTIKLWDSYTDLCNHTLIGERSFC